MTIEKVNNNKKQQAEKQKAEVSCVFRLWEEVKNGVVAAVNNPAQAACIGAVPPVKLAMPSTTMKNS